jgi:hypothetical protein
MEESDADPDAGDNSDAAGADANPPPAGLLAALRAAIPKNLLSEPGPVTPVVVYTGPTRTAEQIAALAALPAYEASKKKSKPKRPGAKTAEAKADAKPDPKTAKKEIKKDTGKATGKPAQHKPSSGKTTDRSVTAQ